MYFQSLEAPGKLCGLEDPGGAGCAYFSSLEARGMLDVRSSSAWRCPSSISLCFHRKSCFMEAPQVFGPGGILKSAGRKEKLVFFKFYLQRPRFFAWSKLGVGTPPTELTKVSPG